MRFSGDVEHVECFWRSEEFAKRETWTKHVITGEKDIDFQPMKKRASYNMKLKHFLGEYFPNVS